MNVQADKLVCLTMPGMLPFQLPSSLTVREAQSLLNTLAAEKAANEGVLMPLSSHAGHHQIREDHVVLPDVTMTAHLKQQAAARLVRTEPACCMSPGGSSSAVQPGADAQVRRWQKYGLPGPLVAACSACIDGVRRSHLVCPAPPRRPSEFAICIPHPMQ